MVLDGLRNVADTLQACTLDADTLSAQVAAEQSAAQSLALVEQQLKLGSATSLQLLTAQQQVTQSRLSTLAARAQRLSDSVAFYQAMGSENSAYPPKDSAPDPIQAAATTTQLSIHSQPEKNTK